jgi:hypothetical protein
MSLPDPPIVVSGGIAPQPSLLPYADVPWPPPPPPTIESGGNVAL